MIYVNFIDQSLRGYGPMMELNFLLQYHLGLIVQYLSKDFSLKAYVTGASSLTLFPLRPFY